MLSGAVGTLEQSSEAPLCFAGMGTSASVPPSLFPTPTPILMSKVYLTLVLLVFIIKFCGLYRFLYLHGSGVAQIVTEFILGLEVMLATA